MAAPRAVGLVASAAAVSWLALQCCQLLHVSSTASCTVDVNKDLVSPAPLLLVDGDLSWPHGGEAKDSAVISFSGGATLACPGRRNRLEGLRRQQVDVTCRRGSTVTLAGRSVSLRDLRCSGPLSATLEVTDQPCGQGAGVHVGTGFQVGGKFQQVIATCHDRQLVATLYSQHVLDGSGIRGRRLDQNKPWFESGSLNRGFSIATLYTQRSVSETLTRLLGSKPLANSYTTQTFISRGHLSPRADFILQAYQNASYFYVNAAPQWQAVNAGNWLQVEITVRRHAERHGSKLLIVTGTYEVLALQNQQGRPKKVYLYDDGQVQKLPVPKFLWKVVQNPDTKSAVAFVTINNPFLKNVADEDILCEDVCRDNDWGTSSWHTVSLGYTYCCEVDKLRSVISHIPALDAFKVLRNK